MGRNNDTFTLVIDNYRAAWSKFRRALRKEDQELFDELWRAPKVHLAAGAFLAAESPLETIMMSMLLEQYKRVKHLETALYMLQQAHHDPVLGEPQRALILPPAQIIECSPVPDSPDSTDSFTEQNGIPNYRRDL